MRVGIGIGLNYQRPSSGGAPPALVLDSLSAGAAYSTRKLRTAYAGAAIRVRRSSDNVEADIGFSGNSLDTAALTAHVGASSGFVVTWYDQSGNARNVTQATTTSQPRIVNAGTIEVQNTKPSIFFDGTAHHLFNSSPFLYAATGWTAQFVLSGAGQADRRVIAEGASTGNNPIFSIGTKATNTSLGVFLRNDAGTEILNAAAAPGITSSLDSTLRSITIRDNQTVIDGFNNGTAASPQGSYARSGALTLNRFAIGALVRAAAGSFFSGYISEVIIFEAFQSNTDINTVGLSQGGEYGITVVPFLVGEELDFFGKPRDGIFAETNTNWEGYTATFSQGDRGFAGSVGYPFLHRSQTVATAGAANRVSANADSLNGFNSYMSAYYTGGTARVFRPISGVMTLIRESSITAAKIGQWSWLRPNANRVLDTTSYTHMFDGFNKSGTPYWFRVAAVGSDGKAGAFTSAVSYTPSNTAAAATTPTNTTRAFDKTANGGALSAPTGFTVTAGTPDRLAVLSWSAVAGAEGYVVELSYYDPATEIDATAAYIDLASHANPILTGDIVIIEKQFLTLDDTLVCPRIYDANPLGSARPNLFWFYNNYLKRDGEDWSFVAYSGDKPAIAKGDHFFRRIAPAGQTALMQYYWQSGTDQNFYSVLKVGVTYRLRVVMRASTPVNVTFTPGGLLTGTTFTSVGTTFTEYTHDMVPASQPSGSTPYDWQLTFTAGGSPVNLDVAYFAIEEVGVSANRLAGSPPAQGVYLRDHSFIKSGINNRSMLRLIDNGVYDFKEFHELCTLNNAKPWFQIEWNTPKADWLDFVAYLAAPNASGHPMATLRLAQGIADPWTTTFPDIILEMGNENWNFTGGFWPFPGSTDTNGTVYNGGATGGLFCQMISDWMKESPYWSTLEPKLTQHFGGWVVNSFGEDAYRRYPDAKEISVVAYNGGWDNGTALVDEKGLSFGGILADPIIIQKPRAIARVTGLKSAATAIGKTYGTDVRATIYEGGPGYQLSGLNGASVTAAQVIVQEVVMKSRAAAVSTVDNMLTYAQQDYLRFNYFTTAQGDYWTSHAKDIDGGQEFMTHALLRIIHENIAPAKVYGALTASLGLCTVTLQGGGTQDINQIGAYQLRSLATPSKRMIVVVNRNIDPSQLDPTDPLYSATPSGTVAFNLTTTWNSASSLKVWTAGVGPYRQHNRYPVGQRRLAAGGYASDPLCVAFDYSSTTKTVPANIQDFAINDAVGAAAGGLPAGSCLIMLFEGVT
jgi:hypothetical protein